MNNVSTKLMKDLYFHWNSDVDCVLSYTCCPTIQPITLSILDSFFRLATNQIFCCNWSKTLSIFLKQSHDSPITQDEIVTSVWKPTLYVCVELINDLESGEITLQKVDQVFGDEKVTDMKNDCESLVKELSSCLSHKGLNVMFCSCECCSTIEIQQFFENDTTLAVSSDTSWIETVREQIEHYRLSQKCIECAKALTILCDEDHLNLTGDFGSIHVLGNKVMICIALEVLVCLWELVILKIKLPMQHGWSIYVSIVSPS